MLREGYTLYSKSVSETMAVLCTCSSGWFVSHSKLVESWFKVLNTAGETSPSSMKLRDVFFDVKTPFRMDSAATKEASSFGMNDDTPVAKTVRILLFSPSCLSGIVCSAYVRG